MRRRSRRSLIIWGVVAVLAVGPIVAFVLYRTYLSAEIESKLQAIRDAGYPVTLEELAAWVPAVPYGENAAMVYGDACAAFPSKDDKAFKELDAKVPVVSTVRLPAAGEPLPEEMQKDVAAYLDACSETMKLLHIAGAMKRSRYQINYSAGLGMRLNHLAQCRHAARLLKLEAVLTAEQGDTGRAMKAVMSSLGIARSLRREPMLISQLVRIAIRYMAWDSLARGLSRRQFKDAELQELEEAFRAELDKEMMVRALAGERCCGIPMFQMMASGKLGQGALGGMNGPKLIPPSILAMTGLLDKDMLLYIDLLTGMVESSKLPWHEQIAAGSMLDTKLRHMMGRKLRRACSVTLLLVPALTRVSIEGAKSAAKIEMARAALAVERFRLKYGTLPDDLAEVAPEFVVAVPTDPFDGKALRYKKMETGYMVYSIGMNGKDDGGVEYGDEKHRGERLDEVMAVKR